MQRLVATLVVVVVGTLLGCGDDSALDDAMPDAADATPIDAAPIDAPTDAAPDASEPAGELRGIWVTRFAYTTQPQLEAIIDRAAAAGFNAVFLQIRAEADAYYDSALEPWSRRLTGTLGRAPGWDPLRIALDRAHGHGIELHAYFNVFSAWPAAGTIPVAEGPRPHPLVAHPEWLAVDSTGVNRDPEYRWLSPGNPAVRAHVVAVARDLLAKYEVDGLHLDRIRVAGPDYSHDAVAQAAFLAAQAANPALTWADFMRGQVSAMVAELYAALTELRPAAALSAAVWGIYTPLPGCSTSQGYGQFYQDSYAWVAGGTIDALAPMVYWPIAPGACTDWSTLVDGFLAARAGRHIWAGMHALEGTTYDFTAIAGRIDRARTAGAQGTVLFASSYLDEGPLRWEPFAGTPAAPGPYAEPAPTPAMPWK